MNIVDIQIISSGSREGNCYLVSDGQTRILLDIGIPFKELQLATRHTATSISAILITHEHQDHSKGCAKAMKAGIDIYFSRGTAEALKLLGHRAHFVQSEQKFTIGTFDCVAFKAIHDCVEPLGFVLTSRITGERVIYATDTCFLEYTVPGITHWLIECNFDDDSLEMSVDSGQITKELAERIRRTHMSLQNLLATLAANDLSKTKEIYLIHLSENNAYMDYMKREVQKATGVAVFTAASSTVGGGN